MTKKSAIITAGGVGKRMGGEVPKQFLEIGGVPILRRCMELFISLPFEVEVIVVINREYKDLWKDYCLKYNFNYPHILVSGGITRFHSVKAGLKFVAPDSIVAVHDGVRPFVSKELICSLFERAESCDAVIPVTKVTDSVRQINEDNVSKSIDREQLLLVQTPQVFRSNILIDSYKQAFSPKFTDDASVVESRGYSLTLAEGERFNLKITTPEDILLANAYLELL